jgi:hypothetical protein
MNTADSDLTFTFRGLYCQATISRKRLLVLGYLVPFGQIGIKVILPGEYAGVGDFTI